MLKRDLTSFLFKYFTKFIKSKDPIKGQLDNEINNRNPKEIKYIFFGSNWIL